MEGLILAVGDFDCPKCGTKMESGHMKIVAGEGGFHLFFKPLCFPWELPLEELKEKRKEQGKYERILGAMFNYESDVHRCPKCRLMLLGY
jgi:predicted nucleic-acid-binding Zn-ribbon protein